MATIRRSYGNLKEIFSIRNYFIKWTASFLKFSAFLLVVFLVLQSAFHFVHFAHKEFNHDENDEIERTRETSSSHEPKSYVGGPAYTCHSHEIEKQARKFAAASKKFRPAFGLGCADAVNIGLFLTTLWDAKSSNVTLINIGANKGYNLAEWFELWLPEFKISPRSWGQEYLYSNYPKQFQAWVMCGVCSDCTKDPIRWRIASQNKGASSGGVTIMAIEPSESNFQILKNFKEFSHSNQLKLFRLAMSNSSGLSSFPITRLGSELGSLDPSISDPYTHSVSVSDRNRVSLQTVDSFWEEQGLNMVHLLKIDTEGFDALVLEGAEHVLKSRAVKLLEFEYHGIGPWKNIQLKNVVEKLDNFGYDCYLKLPLPSLVRLTRCFHSAYEFHMWSNVVCANRRETPVAGFLLSHAVWL